ncbi:MAG TPA: dihydrodipicolinate synthase family protein [Chitinophagaceae bacterium]|nr:dihydrodipicolinate synthase family protein [Chitinophagaceae bacterium]
MNHQKKLSRRSALQKIAAGSFGAALVAGLASKSAARNLSKNKFESGKKFVPVMITPYGKDGKIDYSALGALMDFYIAAGVKGFFANCASSEMYALDSSEKLALTEYVVKRTNHKLTVVASGSFGDTIEAKAEFAKKIYDKGVNGVITITSLLATKDESDDVLIKNYEKFFSLTGNIPMGTYECPSPYKRILTPYVFKWLLGTGRMVYHKDTTIDFLRVKEKIELSRGNKIEFYDACVANTMYSLQAGAKGMSAISGNFYPEILVWMCNNSTNPDKQQDVKYIQEQLTKTEDIISQNYPLSSKYFLRKRGIPIEVASRLSTTALTPELTQRLDETYEVFKGWCSRIGIQPVKV